MKYIIIVMLILVSLFFLLGETPFEEKNSFKAFDSIGAYSEATKSNDNESYGFFDFIWDAISFIFKGSIAGILIWGAKLYYDNE